jgi:hypothetical protein
LRNKIAILNILRKFVNLSKDNYMKVLKVQPITNEKVLLLQEIREAVDTVNLVKGGKLFGTTGKRIAFGN